MTSKLLRPNESPLQVLPELASWIGLNEAILLQQLHWLIENEKGQQVAGIRWVRMTTEEWQEVLPFFDHNTIKRTIANLSNDGLLLAATFSGRSKWYTVCYGVVEELSGPVSRLVELSNKRKEARHKASAQLVPIEANNDVSAQLVPINSTISADASAQLVPLLREEKNHSKTPSLNARAQENSVMPGTLAVAVLEACELDFDAVETVKTVKLDFTDTMRFLAKKEAEPGQVRNLRRYWNDHDYRSKDGSKAPSLKQFVEVWIPFTKWIEDGCPAPEVKQYKNGGSSNGATILERGKKEAAGLNPTSAAIGAALLARARTGGGGT